MTKSEPPCNADKTNGQIWSVVLNECDNVLNAQYRLLSALRVAGAVSEDAVTATRARLDQSGAAVRDMWSKL